MSKIWAYFLVFVSFIISLFYFSDLQYFFDYLFISIEGISFQDYSVLSRYQDTMESGNVSFLNLASFVLPCIVSIYCASENEINNKNFKMYIMSVCLYNLFSSSTFMLRFIGVFFILGYPSAIPNATSKNKILLSFYLSITLYYLLKMINIYANWPVNISSDLPYKFVWE